MLQYMVIPCNTQRLHTPWDCSFPPKLLLLLIVVVVVDCCCCCCCFSLSKINRGKQTQKKTAVVVSAGKTYCLLLLFVGQKPFPMDASLGMHERSLSPLSSTKHSLERRLDGVCYHITRVVYHTVIYGHTYLVCIYGCTVLSFLTCFMVLLFYGDIYAVFTPLIGSPVVSQETFISGVSRNKTLFVQG